MKSHFDKENQRIDDFLKSRKEYRIEMDNGQIIEKYSMKETKDLLKETLDNIKIAERGNGSFLGDGSNAYSIMYNNGDVIIVGDDGDIGRYHTNFLGEREYSTIGTKDVKLSNIRGIINDNPATSAFSGKGVVIENYNEVYRGTEKGVEMKRRKDGSLKRREFYKGYGTAKEYDDWRLDFGDKPRRYK